MQERIGIRIQQSFNFALGCELDQLGIEMIVHPRRQAPAQHQPLSIGQQFLDSLDYAILLRWGNLRPAFIQLYREALTVGDRKIRPDPVANFNDFLGEGVFLQMLFQFAANLASGSGDGDYAGPEAGEDPGSIDSAASGGFGDGFNVGSILKYKPVHRDDSIDGGVQG